MNLKSWLEIVGHHKEGVLSIDGLLTMHYARPDPMLAQDLTLCLHSRRTRCAHIIGFMAWLRNGIRKVLRN